MQGHTTLLFLIMVSSFSNFDFFLFQVELSHMTSRMIKIVEPDQTAPEEQSDLGLHCFLEHFYI